MKLDIIPPPEPPPSTYVLTLTASEADDLRQVVGMVSGRGRVRETVNALYRSLYPHFPYRDVVKKMLLLKDCE